MSQPRYAIASALALALAGCGEDSSESKKGGDGRACRSPLTGVSQDARPKRLAMGETIGLDFSKATPTAGRVALTVTEARTVDSIKDRFGDKRVRRPAPGYGFLAVIYEFENLDKKSMEAANSISNIMLARGSGGQAWQRVDRAEGCTAISSSLAPTLDVQDPEKDVGAGKGYKTVVVYSVPNPDKRRYAWNGLDVDVRLKVGS